MALWVTGGRQGGRQGGRLGDRVIYPPLSPERLTWRLLVTRTLETAAPKRLVVGVFLGPKSCLSRHRASLPEQHLDRTNWRRRVLRRAAFLSLPEQMVLQSLAMLVQRVRYAVQPVQVDRLEVEVDQFAQR